jgi:hypothetical protein
MATSPWHENRRTGVARVPVAERAKRVHEVGEGVVLPVGDRARIVGELSSAFAEVRKVDSMGVAVAVNVAVGGGLLEDRTDWFVRQGEYVLLALGLGAFLQVSECPTGRPVGVSDAGSVGDEAAVLSDCGVPVLDGLCGEVTEYFEVASESVVLGRAVVDSRFVSQSHM